MNRQSVEGHITKLTKNPVNRHEDIWIVNGVILIDGQEKSFAAWDYEKKLAEKRFNTFTDSRCICVHPENPLGETPPCPVHAEGKVNE